MASKRRCRALRATRNFAIITIFGVLFSLLCPLVAHGEGTPIFYSVKLPFIRDDIALHIRLGDAAIEPVGKEEIGRVVSVEYAKAIKENYSTEKNEMVLSECEGYCDVTLTLSCKGELTDTGARLGSLRIYSGMPLSVRLPDFYGAGVCTHISEVGYEKPD